MADRAKFNGIWQDLESCSERCDAPAARCATWGRLSWRSSYPPSRANNSTERLGVEVAPLFSCGLDRAHELDIFEALVSLRYPRVPFRAFVAQRFESRPPRRLLRQTSRSVLDGVDEDQGDESLDAGWAMFDGEKRVLEMSGPREPQRGSAGSDMLVAGGRDGLRTKLGGAQRAHRRERFTLVP